MSQPLPRKITYDLGRDSYGRRLELIIEGDEWTLSREAASQRDEAVWLEITPLQAAAIAEIVKS
jgi:hypothetical protein